MTVVSDLIEQTTDHLYGTARATLNLLAVSVDSDDTTWTFSDDIGGTIGPGSFLDIDSELVYVRTVEAASKQAVVARARRGTTAASHTAGTFVEVNPRFPRYRIMRALLEDIRSWPDTLYQTITVDLDSTSGTAGYNLAVDPGFLAVVDIQSSGVDSLSNRWSRPAYDVLRNADTGAFSSGTGIVFERGYRDVRDLRAVVAVPFDLLTWDVGTDLEIDCGIPESMHDIPPYGAVMRLMAGRDVKRSFGEGAGESRTADEVPAGFSSSVATYLRRERDRRISEEAVRLRAKNPLRSL
jgi:hypothetical protein